MRKQINKNIIKEIKPEKTTDQKEIFWEWLNLHRWEVTITTREWAKKFGAKFVDWAMNESPKNIRDKAYNVDGFCIQEGISRENLEKMIEVYPEEFGEQYKFGLMVIGNRRYKGMIAAEGYKELNYPGIVHTQSQYDKSWKIGNEESDERKRKLAEDENKKAGETKYVVLERGKDCEIVPVCEEDK